MSVRMCVTKYAHVLTVVVDSISPKYIILRAAALGERPVLIDPTSGSSRSSGTAPDRQLWALHDSSLCRIFHYRLTITAQARFRVRSWALRMNPPSSHT
ncbi:hypothetical protein PABG_02235 [Paracoccidioides brasiliensis Pb03]|nr:hypothetical protein PABG_02235 [Paracoccidioides brasiliensis Pb03]